MDKVQDILTFWFEQAGEEKWWVKDPDFDAQIRQRYQDAHTKAAAGQMDHWMESAEGALALILLLDQFPRNIYRGSAFAFATDEKALNLARQALEQGYDKALSVEQASFFYLPFMHSERLEDQEKCVELFEAISDQVPNLPFAIAHRDVIQKFGRFPHRNKVLSRRTTAEEQAYLDDGGGF